MQNVYHDDFPLYDETIKRQTAGGGSVPSEMKLQSELSGEATIIKNKVKIK